MSAAALKARTREAIQELRELRCPDPAAAGAIDAIRLTVHTLEQWWLPELSRLTSGV
jgi:hypothetical protein